MGIEAGYAYAKGIPIAVIAKKGSDVSATLQGISQKLFLYDEFDDLTRFFKDTTLVWQSNEGFGPALRLPER